jgi:hypothetical protein
VGATSPFRQHFGVLVVRQWRQWRGRNDERNSVLDSAEIHRNPPRGQRLIPDVQIIRRRQGVPAARQSQLLCEVQRSVVSQHPEEHNPANCIGCKNPGIAIFVPNRTLIYRLHIGCCVFHSKPPDSRADASAKGCFWPVPDFFHRLAQRGNCTPEIGQKIDKNK